MAENTFKGPSLEKVTRSIPNWLLSIVRLFTPAAHRGKFEGDLLELQLTPGQFARCSAFAIGGFLRSGIEAGYSPLLLFGEVVFLFLPLLIRAPKAPILPLELVLITVLAVSRLRDAYSYPAEGSVAEMFTDAGFTAGAVMLLEIALAIAAPSLALSALRFFQAVTGVFMVAQWRMLYHREDPPDPIRRHFLKRRIATFHIHLLFAATAAPLILTSIKAAPGTRFRDLAVASWPVVLGLAWRLKKNRWVYLKEIRIQDLLKANIQDDEIHELERQLALLPVPDEDLGTRWDLLFEALFFGYLAYIPLMTFAAWLSHAPAAAFVDWTQIEVNAGAVVALLVIWLQIKKYNGKLALELRQAIRLKKLVRKPA